MSKPNITSLTHRRAEVQATVAVLASLEAEGNTLTAEQIEEFETLSAEFETLSSSISRLEQAEQMAAVTAKPVAASSPLYAEPQEPREKGFALSVMVRSLAATKGNARAAAEFAESSCGAPEIAAALNTGTNSAGGFIVPPGYVPEIIELLKPMSVVRSLGARTLPMPNGKASIPKVAGGATASYSGEGADIAISEQTFGDLNLSAKKLTAMVPVSNDLIRFSSPQANDIVRDDVISAMALREDLAFIRDNGTGNLPTGLRYIATGGNVIPANATVNLQNVKNDLGKLELALLNANVKMIQPGWIFTPTVLMFLMNITDGNGNSAFPEVASGFLRGKPYKTTTQVPNNLGSGSDESEIYLTDFADAIIGEATGLILDISTEASYVDGSDTVSAFSRDQTLVRAITEHDFGMRHDGSVAVLTGVTWAP